MHLRIAALLGALLVCLPGFAQADALDDLRAQIEALTAQVRALEMQLKALLARPVSAPPAAPSLPPGNRYAEFFPAVETPRLSVGNTPTPTNDILRIFVSTPSSNAEFLIGTSSKPARASCATRWGDRIILSGETISSEPYFNNGFTSGGYLVPLMRCEGSKWLTCDHRGENCIDTDGRVPRPLCFDNAQRLIEGTGTLVCRAGVWMR